jgi:hypothetical protein
VSGTSPLVFRSVHFLIIFSIWQQKLLIRDFCIMFSVRIRQVSLSIINWSISGKCFVITAVQIALYLKGVAKMANMLLCLVSHMLEHRFSRMHHHIFYLVTSITFSFGTKHYQLLPSTSWLSVPSQAKNNNILHPQCSIKIWVLLNPFCVSKQIIENLETHFKIWTI